MKNVDGDDNDDNNDYYELNEVRTASPAANLAQDDQITKKPKTFEMKTLTEKKSSGLLIRLK